MEQVVLSWQQLLVLLPVREDSYADEQDFIKAGGEELDLVQLQASKTMEQPKIAEKVCMYVLGSSSPS
jgi:hypothetical protein